MRLKALDSSTRTHRGGVIVTNVLVFTIILCALMFGQGPAKASFGVGDAGSVETPSSFWPYETINGSSGDAATLAIVLDCPGDLDGSGDVGITDLLGLLAAWGTNPGGPPDFDGDGNVGITDLLEMLANWGPCP